MERTGRGESFGAVTILNATATGIGCALAVGAKTSATWTLGGDGLRAQSVPDLRLVEAVAEELQAPLGAEVTVEAAFPPARGFKTSSSVAAALVRAGLSAEGKPAPYAEVERVAVAACRRAGVTLTGAYDDQVAVVRGGCHLTDNRQQAILASPEVRPWQVALWVPDHAIPKPTIAAVDPSSAREPAAAAADLVREGRLPEAMTANGQAFHSLYAAAGLAVDDLPTRIALANGALGAGLSGTGPGVAALFERRRELPAIVGGAWRWTRTVPTR